MKVYQFRGNWLQKIFEKDSPHFFEPWEKWSPTYSLAQWPVGTEIYFIITTPRCLNFSRWLWFEYLKRFLIVYYSKSIVFIGVPNYQIKHYPTLAGRKWYFCFSDLRNFLITQVQTMMREECSVTIGTINQDNSSKWQQNWMEKLYLLRSHWA